MNSVSGNRKVLNALQGSLRRSSALATCSRGWYLCMEFKMVWNKYINTKKDMVFFFPTVSAYRCTFFTLVKRIALTLTDFSHSSCRNPAFNDLFSSLKNSTVLINKPIGHGNNIFCVILSYINISSFSFLHHTDALVTLTLL